MSHYLVSMSNVTFNHDFTRHCVTRNVYKLWKENPVQSYYMVPFKKKIIMFQLLLRQITRNNNPLNLICENCTLC